MVLGVAKSSLPCKRKKEKEEGPNKKTGVVLFLLLNPTHTDQIGLLGAEKNLVTVPHAVGPPTLAMNLGPRGSRWLWGASLQPG